MNTETIDIVSDVATSNAELIATSAACVAALGASYAAIITELFRRRQIRSERKFHLDQEVQRRRLDAAEQNSSWLRAERATAYANIIDRLRAIVTFYQATLVPAYSKTPIGHLERERQELLRLFGDLHTAVYHAILSASLNMSPILQDILGLSSAVFTPYPSPDGNHSTKATKRIELEFHAASYMIAGMMDHGRASLQWPEPGNILPPARLPDRSWLHPQISRAEVVKLLEDYQVQRMVGDPHFEIMDGDLEAFHESYPYWPRDIDAIVVDSGSSLTFAVRKGLADEKKDAIRVRVAREVESGMSEGAPEWRNGAVAGEKVYLYLSY